MRKTKQIKRKEIIFELDEWARIEQAAQSLNLKTSEYIRSMTLHGNVVQIDLSQVAPLVNGMRTISNNINQIARKANETHSVHAVDVMQMRNEVTELCRLLNLCLSALQSKRV